MIGMISIYRGTGSISAREYPYFAQGATVSPVPVQSFEGKFTEDLDQSIQVPVFDGWSSCNLLKLSSGTFSQWMWITDVSRTSDTAGSVTLACTWCPTMDISERDDYTTTRTYVGDWLRRPSPDLSRPIHMEVAPGTEEYMTLKYQIKQCRDCVSPSGLKGTLAWCQVTFSSGSGNAAKIGQYGFFVDAAYPADGIQLGGGNGVDIWYKYPTLIEVLTKPYASMGINASNIIDISISAIPPFKPVGNASLPVVNIEDSTGGYLNPTLISGTERYAYDMSSGTAPMPYWEQSYTATYSTVESYCGSMRLQDPWGATIGAFPQTAGVGGTHNQHKIIVRAITDTTGITLMVSLDDTVLKTPMPHLPYIGTQWDEYRAYSMAFDRQAMEYSISSSREALQISKDTAAMNTAISVGSSLLSGNIGGAISSTLGTLIGMQAQDRGQVLSEKNARFTQALTESRVQAASPTTYASGYGFADILRMATAHFEIVWFATAGTSASQYVNCTARTGVPVNRYNFAMPMEAEGYYQGCIYSRSAPVHGARLDRLNELLQSGIIQVLYKDVTN